MKSLVAVTATALTCACLMAGTARAQDVADEDCRLETIPARTERVERTIEVPAITKTRRVPVYEQVEVPIYECIEEPRFKQVRVPVYSTREIPVYKTERVPVYGMKDVPIYKKVEKPVTIKVWNPFCCEDEKIELWDECADVQVGTRQERGVVGHRDEQVQCGTRTERFISGHRLERVQDGTTRRAVQTGTQTVQRLTGYKTEQVLVEPATTRTVVDVVEHPCRTVTVIPDGATRTQPLEGSSEVLTRSEYERLSTR